MSCTDFGMIYYLCTIETVAHGGLQLEGWPIQNVFVPCGPQRWNGEVCSAWRGRGLACERQTADGAESPTDTLLTEREGDSAKADSYKNGGIHLICDLREKIIDFFCSEI